MGVDFHWIGTTISSGSSHNGFGKIVSFPSVVSFPANGSYNSTLYSVTYPVAEGGSSFTNPVIGGAVPNQQCDVDVENDGAGGTYTDWSTVTSVAYKSFGESFYLDATPQPLGIEVPSSSSTYYTGGTQLTEYYHDGYGSFYNQGVSPSYYSMGTDTNLLVLDVNQQTEVPSGSGTYFNNGQKTGYSWDGIGGYNYPVTKGNYYNNGVLITFIPDSTYSGGVNIGGTIYYSQFCGNDYFWDGSGGTSGAVPVCKYYTNGTFIFNDGTADYYWDGTGGYYSV